VNISRIGHTSLFNTTDGDGGFFDNLVNSLQEDLNDLINDVTSNIAEALDLPDFLRVHVMDFCQGEYSPNSTVRNPSMNTTECSNRTTFFHFRPTEIIEERLPSGITLEDIHWPDEIRDAERAVTVATNAMVVCYIIGIIFAGLAIFTAIWALFSSGRLSPLINFVTDMVSVCVTLSEAEFELTNPFSCPDCFSKSWHCLRYCDSNHCQGYQRYQSIWR